MYFIRWIFMVPTQFILFRFISFQEQSSLLFAQLNMDNDRTKKNKFVTSNRPHAINRWLMWAIRKAFNWQKHITMLILLTASEHMSITENDRYLILNTKNVSSYKYMDTVHHNENWAKKLPPKKWTEDVWNNNKRRHFNKLYSMIQCKLNCVQLNRLL